MFRNSNNLNLIKWMKAICARAQRDSERYWMIMASHKKAIVRRHKDSFVQFCPHHRANCRGNNRSHSLAFFNVPYSYTLCLLYYSALPQTNILALGIGPKEAFWRWRLSGLHLPAAESERKWSEKDINSGGVCLARHCLPKLSNSLCDRAKSCPNKGNL